MSAEVEQRILTPVYRPFPRLSGVTRAAESAEIRAPKLRGSAPPRRCARRRPTIVPVGNACSLRLAARRLRWHPPSETEPARWPLRHCSGFAARCPGSGRRGHATPARRGVRGAGRWAVSITKLLSLIHLMAPAPRDQPSRTVQIVQANPVCCRYICSSVDAGSRGFRCGNWVEAT